MYLADTNLFLEVLLEQEKADEVVRFLKSVPANQLCLSEFTLYSIGVSLIRHKKFDLFMQFINDISEAGIATMKLERADMKRLVDDAKQFNLDFDDAYQYVVAEKNDLILVSFDRDFDQTQRGRKTPLEILKSYQG